MAILLVRHGETIDNASHTFQTPSSPLSNDGNKQAERLAKRLSSADISDIICSDYLRTKQTASYMAQKIEVEPIYTELLRERNFGDIRGRPYAELGFDPFALDYHPVNGESWTSFDARVAQAWELVGSVAAQAMGDVLVVTHGFVCRAIVANHARLEDGLEVPTRWGNTSLTEIESTSPWSVNRLNCVEHLGFSGSSSNPDSAQV